MMKEAVASAASHVKEAIPAVASYTKDAFHSVISSLYSGYNLIPSKIFAWAETSDLCQMAKIEFENQVAHLNKETEAFKILEKSGSATLEQFGKYLSTDQSRHFGLMNKAYSVLTSDACDQTPYKLPELDPIINKALEIYNLTPQQVPFFGPEADLFLLTGLAIGGSIALFAWARKRYSNIFYKSQQESNLSQQELEGKTNLFNSQDDSNKLPFKRVL